MNNTPKLLATICAVFLAGYASACAALGAFNQIYAQFLYRHFSVGSSDYILDFLVTGIIFLILANIFVAYQSHMASRKLNSLYPNLSFD